MTAQVQRATILQIYKSEDEVERTLIIYDSALTREWLGWCYDNDKMFRADSVEVEFVTTPPPPPLQSKLLQKGQIMSKITIGSTKSNCVQVWTVSPSFLAGEYYISAGATGMFGTWLIHYQNNTLIAFPPDIPDSDIDEILSHMATHGLINLKE